jgi:glycosyltransferase involved in cell wall biosynthesis
VTAGMLDGITPLIITYNEAPNIARTLAALDWAHRIVVVDSGSTDGTLDILARFTQIEAVHRPFDDFAGQCNFGLTLIGTPWVLSLDADYLLTPELIAELAKLNPEANTMGYRANFIYCIHGRALRASLYPPRVVLFRAGAASYVQTGHAHHLEISGPIQNLRARIRHDDRKPLSRWLVSQRTYAAQEADHLLAGLPLSQTDRLRRMAWPAPLLVLLYVLLVKRCILDGWPGWYYALQRLIAEALLAVEIIDRRRRADGSP